jgi:ribonuclease inhibitor
MAMREIELDGRQMDSRTKAHQYIRETLGLPACYGANLDALSDCLREQTGISIILTHKSAIVNSLGKYGHRLIRVLESSSKCRKDFRFRARD